MCYQSADKWAFVCRTNVEGERAAYCRTVVTPRPERGPCSCCCWHWPSISGLHVSLAGSVKCAIFWTFLDIKKFRAMLLNIYIIISADIIYCQLNMSCIIAGSAVWVDERNVSNTVPTDEALRSRGSFYPRRRHVGWNGMITYAFRCYISFVAWTALNGLQEVICYAKMCSTYFLRFFFWRLIPDKKTASVRKQNIVITDATDSSYSIH